MLYSLPTAGPLLLVDFWWVKPRASDKAVIESETLNLQSKPPHKNDPGRSRALYAQFADLFKVQRLALSLIKMLSPDRPLRVTSRAAADLVAATLMLQVDGSTQVGGGELRFGIESVGGIQRAYIEQLSSNERYFIYLIWQARL